MSPRTGHREQVGREVHHEVWRVWPDNANEAVIPAHMTAEEAANIRWQMDQQAKAAPDRDDRGVPKHVVVKVVTTYEVVQR